MAIVQDPAGEQIELPIIVIALVLINVIAIVTVNAEIIPNACVIASLMIAIAVKR
jgi:hypothetical protein